MVRVSAYPTIEWLSSRACDRKAIPAAVPFRTLGQTISNRMERRLQTVLADHVHIEQSVWITTPDGEKEIQLVLRSGHKRVAIQISNRYGLPFEMGDSVALVYGRFEALYRVYGNHSDVCIHDAIYVLMCDKPSWFSNFGRLSVGRCASVQTILEANTVQERQSEILIADHLRITRMRLCKATDWVTAFENALDARHQFAAD